MHHRDMMPGEMIIVRNLVIYFFNELYVVHSVWLFLTTLVILKDVAVICTGLMRL
jgi:hypothetical protein